MPAASRRTFIIAAALLAAAGPAPGRQRPPPLPPGSWNVNWGDHRCSLIRQSESSPPEYFALQVMPGSYRSDLRVVSRNWPQAALADPSRLTLTFQPQNLVVDGTKRVDETPAGRAFVIGDFPNDLRPALANARSVRVARDGVTLVEIPVPSTGRALAAFRECEVTAMREWGIDPSAQANVRIGPRGNLAAFVTNGDYPDAALRAGAQGTVIFLLHVTAQGRVDSCRTLASSGTESLDAATCRAMRRAQLEPAIGQEGAPVAAIVVSSITWSIRG